MRKGACGSTINRALPQATRMLRVRSDAGVVGRSEECARVRRQPGEDVVEEVLHVEKTAYGLRIRLPEDLRRLPVNVVDIIVGERMYEA
jgi:hypothetical protein